MHFIQKSNGRNLEYIIGIRVLLWLYSPAVQMYFRHPTTISRETIFICRVCLTKYISYIPVALLVTLSGLSPTCSTVPITTAVSTSSGLFSNPLRVPSSRSKNRQECISTRIDLVWNCLAYRFYVNLLFVLINVNILLTKKVIKILRYTIQLLFFFAKL